MFSFGFTIVIFKTTKRDKVILIFIDFNYLAQNQRLYVVLVLVQK